MAERFKAAVLKTVVPVSGTVGSNPTPSALIQASVVEGTGMKLFGSSGIRRVVDDEFLQLASEIGLAVGSHYKSVLIGQDTRTSGDTMKNAFLSGLLATGSNAHDAGIAPTPTVAYACRDYEAGVIITASHNPPEYNGIKLVNPDGSAFDSNQRSQLEELISSKSVQVSNVENKGTCSDSVGVIEEHIERILQDFPNKYNLKVVVDCGCGAASEVTPQLLDKLGCAIIPLYCTPSGDFPRGIEPTEENLQDLIKKVQTENADLGIAHDGDADRIAVVDDKGRLLTGDQLIALFARHLGATRVVTTVDASMLIDDIGFEVKRTRVGDAFVSDELRKSVNSSVPEFGGEASGCYIFPQISLCPDAIYAVAVIIQIASVQKISSLVDELPSYELLRGGVPGDRAVMPMLEVKLRDQVKTGGSLDTIDGLRLGYNDGWLLIRPSGTEPKIRLTAEAKSEERAKELYELGLDTIKSCLAEQEGAKR